MEFSISDGYLLDLLSTHLLQKSVFSSVNQMTGHRLEPNIGLMTISGIWLFGYLADLDICYRLPIMKLLLFHMFLK